MWSHYFLWTPLACYNVCIAFVISYILLLINHFFFQWFMSISPWNWWETICDFDHFKSANRTKNVEYSLLNSDCQRRKTGTEMTLLFFRMTRWFAWWEVHQKDSKEEGTREVHLLRAEPREMFSFSCLLSWAAATYLRGVVGSQLE